MSAALAEARAATEEAVARVERNADQEWKDAAQAAVRWLAERRERFTTDAVWHVLKRDYPLAETHEPRALGPVMRRAVTLGVIEPTDVYHRSIRPECHRNPKRVWRSKLARS